MSEDFFGLWVIEIFTIPFFGIFWNLKEEQKSNFLS